MMTSLAGGGLLDDDELARAATARLKFVCDVGVPANFIYLGKCHYLRHTASTGIASKNVATSCAGDTGLPVHDGARFCVQVF